MPVSELSANGYGLVGSFEGACCPEQSADCGEARQQDHLLEGDKPVADLLGSDTPERQGNRRLDGRMPADREGANVEAGHPHHTPERRQRIDQRRNSQDSPASHAPQCTTCQGMRRLVRRVKTDMYRCGFRTEAYTCPACRGTGRYSSPQLSLMEGAA